MNMLQCIHVHYRVIFYILFKENENEKENHNNLRCRASGGLHSRVPLCVMGSTENKGRFLAEINGRLSARSR